MKSEHRHDLQTNELGKMVERMGTFMEIHGNRLMIGVFVVALAIAGAIFWSRKNWARQSAAWHEFAIAVRVDNPEDYHDVWQKYKGTPVGLWAGVHEGEGWLSLGVQNMFRNVETATGELEKSRDAFQAVVNDRSAPPEIRERALIGLAHALESLSSGNQSDVIKTYESLLKEFPNSIYKEDAQQRLTELKKHGEEFYTWFSKYPRPKLPEKRPHDKGSSAPFDEEIENFAEDLSKLSGGSKPEKKPASDDQSPKLPDLDESDSEKKPAPEDADEAAKKPVEEGKAEPQADPTEKPDSQPEEQGESKESGEEK